MRVGLLLRRLLALHLFRIFLGPHSVTGSLPSGDVTPARSNIASRGHHFTGHFSIRNCAGRAHCHPPGGIGFPPSICSWRQSIVRASLRIPPQQPQPAPQRGSVLAPSSMQNAEQRQRVDRALDQGERPSGDGSLLTTSAPPRAPPGPKLTLLPRRHTKASHFACFVLLLCKQRTTRSSLRR